MYHHMDLMGYIWNHVCDSHITFTKGCEKFVGCDLASLFPEISILSSWVGESWLFLVVDMEVKYQSCNVLYIYLYMYTVANPFLDLIAYDVFPML